MRILKTVLAILMIFSLCTLAQAKVYVTLDNLTGEPTGSASISDKAVADWAKNFILIEADKTYQGKNGYEIKYDNETLRHATQIEIDTYLQQQEQNQQNIENEKNKQILLDLLDNESVKTKIKDIKNQP